jgi:hypothetical protein
MHRAMATTLTIGITALALGAGAAPQTQSSGGPSKKCEQATSSEKARPDTHRHADLSRSTSSGARTGGKGSAPGSGFHTNRAAGGPPPARTTRQPRVGRARLLLAQIADGRRSWAIRETITADAGTNGADVYRSQA